MSYTIGSSTKQSTYIFVRDHLNSKGVASHPPSDTYVRVRKVIDLKNLIIIGEERLKVEFQFKLYLLLQVMN